MDDVLDVKNGDKDNQHHNCMYFVPKKKRYCRLSRMKGKDYCVEHLHLFSSTLETRNDKDARIVCPLDPTHTCSKIGLDKHLKKCNAKKLVPTEPWYVFGINYDGIGEGLHTVNFLKDVTVQECKALIGKIHALKAAEYKSSDVLHTHPALEKDLQEFKNCPNALKQATQNSALLSLMEKRGLLDHPACFIEFGAGRGQLTSSLVRAIPTSIQSGCSFVLVDRGTNRRKLDAKHRRENHAHIERIRVDIKDLCIRNIGIVKSKPELPLIAISKHLCGEATDLALKCFNQTSLPLSDHGGIIALCCHHRCTWANYCGKKYFLSMGLTARDFSIIALMSSWAVCHFRDLPTREKTDCVERDPNRLDFLSDKEKESVGAICKMLIDRGRVKFMLERSFDCKLVQYTSKIVSLENIALVFVRPK